MAVHCPSCGLLFRNRFQLGPHRRVCPAPIDNSSVSTSGSTSTVPNVISAPNVISVSVVNVVRVPAGPVPLHVLAQRPARQEEPWGRAVPCVRRARPLRLHLVRDYLPVSMHVHAYCSYYFSCCCFFLCVHTL